jgi:hypothetical protein
MLDWIGGILQFRQALANQLFPFAQFCDVTYYGSQLRLPRKTTRGYVRLFLNLFFKARKLELQRLESLVVNKSLIKHMPLGSAH